MLIRTFIATILLFTLTQTVSSKTIKIMHQKNYYPYAFINDEGEPDGVIIDYWKLWSIKNSINIEFIHSDNPNYINDLINGKADIISGMKFNENWVDSINYTEYILRVNTTIFLRNDKKPKSIQDIDFAIATIDNRIINSNRDSILSGIEFRYLNNFDSFRNEIKEQNIEGYIYDIPLRRVQNNSLKIPKGYYEFKIVKLDYIRPVIRLNDTEFQQLILKGSSIITEEELTNLAEKWNLISKDNTARNILIISALLLLLISIIFILIILKQKKQSKKFAGFENEKDWKVIIDKGENDLIEFKSSLRWDYRQEKPNKALELVIAKTISAFLNTEGGMLFIGVDDDGNILGIEKDYQTMSKKNSDGFMLALTNVVNQSLGKIHHQSISINIISINEKDVCIISIEKSKSPVFLGKNDNEEFYIRASASSQPMSMSEAYKYITTNWVE